MSELIENVRQKAANECAHKYTNSMGTCGIYCRPPGFTVAQSAPITGWRPKVVKDTAGLD